MLVSVSHAGTTKVRFICLGYDYCEQGIAIFSGDQSLALASRLKHNPFGTRRSSTAIALRYLVLEDQPQRRVPCRPRPLVSLARQGPDLGAGCSYYCVLDESGDLRFVGCTRFRGALSRHKQ
jgi:hypothetical protein